MILSGCWSGWIWWRRGCILEFAYGREEVANCSVIAMAVDVGWWFSLEKGAAFCTFTAVTVANRQERGRFLMGRPSASGEDLGQAGNLGREGRY